jgi:dephospho-CoA kinase
MKVIGLIGGVASGKSTVARWWGAWGAALVHADDLGHDALREPAVVRELVARWGPSVLDAEGKIVRQAVAQRVFGSDASAVANRAFLEETLHPRIRRRAEAALAEADAAGRPAAVLDAPLLVEAGWDALCDLVVWVETPRAARLRYAAGRGWSEDQFAAREAAQMPIEQKRGRATHILENCGTLDDLRTASEAFWRREVLGSKGA